MKIAQKCLSAALSVLLAANVSGCSGLTKQQKSTAIGAGVGGIAGSAVSGGSTLGTVGGAVVGGVVGNEVGKTK
jgi:osmotically inducible lipoprotein OsmB